MLMGLDDDLKPRPTKAMQVLAAFMAAVGKVLPGDVIHDVAPVNRQSQSSADMCDQIDAAAAKRQRKNAKRKANASTNT